MHSSVLKRTRSNVTIGVTVRVRCGSATVPKVP
jgi:hypothetical protein